MDCEKGISKGDAEWQLQNLLVPNKGTMMSQSDQYHAIVEFEMHVCHIVFGWNAD